MKMRIGVPSVILFLLCTLFLYSGCTTMQAYDGPKLSPEKVAILKPSLGYKNVADLLEVDGKKRGTTEGVAEILPGDHTVKIQITSGGWLGAGLLSRIGNSTLSFQARAGHTYLFDGKIIEGDTFAWIVDEATNEVVAGKKP